MDYNGLIDRLIQLEQAYYVDGQALASDAEYDALLAQAQAYEAEHPDQMRPDSPSHRVGSDLTNDFPEVQHSTPVLSLDKAYSADEVLRWIAKMPPESGVYAEQKLDGFSIVLYYENGVLARAVTRGNGSVGNDVSANVRTIGSIPLQLPEPVTAAVRGEIFLSKGDFERINRHSQEAGGQSYANPRNLAAGTVRRIKSSQVAQVPLRIFVYDAVLAPQDLSRLGIDSHGQLLERLGHWGLAVNPANRAFVPEANDDAQEQLQRFVASFIEDNTQGRGGLDYEIDGLVFKVDHLPTRQDLGYTGHHPRWAIAYKFDSPQGTSTLLSIEVQVGRTGRITPVAKIEPVVIGGATIQNVTLHNQDYIDQLSLVPGDKVLVSRRGDVIPAIESVIEKGEGSQSSYHLPDNCPSCQGPLELRGAHHFCSNFHCEARSLGRLRFFVDRRQMDIDGFGQETVDLLWTKGLVRSIPDIYRLEEAQLHGIQGFADKKRRLLIDGIVASKDRPFPVLLASIGLDDLGPRLVETLVSHGYSSWTKLLDLTTSDGAQEALAEIDGIGPKLAQSLVTQFSDPQLQQLMTELGALGLSMEYEAPKAEASADQSMTGQLWCITGSFEHYKPRDLAAEEIVKRGGRVIGSVTGKLTHLLAGEKAGSKLVKAEKVGAQIVSEAEFRAIIGAED